MSSYLFFTEFYGNYGPIRTEICILTRKGSDLYCQPFSRELKYSIKNCHQLSKPIFFKIANNTFEIKCYNHDPLRDVVFNIDEIQYIEPNEKSTRYSAKDSFCIANLTQNPTIYLYFNFCKAIELVDNQK
ncbi:hypothetical protein ACTFIV_007145 [Dictyostelium citrinum]